MGKYRGEIIERARKNPEAAADILIQVQVELIQERIKSAKLQDEIIRLNNELSRVNEENKA